MGNQMTSQPKLAAILFGVMVLAFDGAVGPSLAQSSTEGLARATDAAVAAKPARKGHSNAGKSAAASRTKPQANKAADGAPDASKALPAWMTVDPGRVAHAPSASSLPNEPKSVVSHVPSNDPLEFGGKWNGSNDTAEKTRADNYNGNAAGTGGEVGLKMHF